MLDLLILITTATQPSPPPRKQTDDRRDASAQVSQAEALALSPTTRKNPIVNRIMASTQYVADHIDRIERRHSGHPGRILNSKWLIASYLDMFEDLSPDGTLTPDQLAKVDAYIAKFKSTPAGKSAIAQYRRLS